jgi:secernin
MCDTFVVLPQKTASGKLIFAKNSDREPNEAQAIVRFPKQTYPLGTMLKVTYIEIPQVQETYEVLLSKPFWMWGAEMGVNEYGVVIGNEAVFTKVKFDKSNNGLTGMDLLRLALERAKTAQIALKTITKLLAEYGQDTCGGYQNKDFFYHNSFLIADAQEAYVLETAGREWVVEKVNDTRSISNGLTIGEDYDQISPNAIAFAEQKGWHKKGTPFNFAKSYADPLMTWASGCKIRQSTTEGAIRNSGLATLSNNSTIQQFKIEIAMQILSSHHLPDDEFAPHKGSTKDVCMHATSLLNPSHTVGSMVAEIGKNNDSTFWFTGTSNPCLSFFKPMFLGERAIQNGIEPIEKPDNSFWWCVEKVHRLSNKNYPQISQLLHKQWAGLQEDLMAETQKLFDKKATDKEFKDLSINLFLYHGDKVNEIYEALKNIKSNHFSPLYELHWRKNKAVF